MALPYFAKFVTWSDWFLADDAVSMVVWSAFYYPVKSLYRWGPSFMTPFGHFGFWGGKKLHEICEQITSLDADYWVNHEVDCKNIYKEKVLSLCYA